MSSDAPKKGRLILISGPSGAGKTSICNALLQRLPRARWSVSATTRPPRKGDVPGETYEFVSREEFRRRIESGELLEWAEYVGHRYGTPRRAVEASLKSGEDVIVEIDVQGGMQVAKKMPESVRVFVMPPTMETLRSRLEGRQTEQLEQLEKRLAEADGEIAAARDSGAYDYFVTNNVLQDTVEQILRIIEEHETQ